MAHHNKSLSLPIPIENNMKKVFLFILTCFLLASCEKSESNSCLLVGKWQLVKYEQETIYANGNIVKTDGAIDGEVYRVFTNDGTVKCTDKKGTITEYTYSLDSENMTLTIGSEINVLKELSKTSFVTVSTTYFLDGSVKPVGKGTTNFYYYWNKIK